MLLVEKRDFLFLKTRVKERAVKFVRATGVDGHTLDRPVR